MKKNGRATQAQSKRLRDRDCGSAGERCAGDLMLLLREEHRAACACHGAVEAQGFCEKALIIMKSPSSTLLKMHDVVAILYMLELQPVSQPSNPFLRTDGNMM